MYEFTEDWFSANTGEQPELIFEHHLSKYAGKPCNFLEIGSFEGRSAIWMLENILTNPESRLVCIDRWASWTNDSFLRLSKNLYASGHKDKVDIIKGKSQDYTRLLPKNSFDFIYVDGDHSPQAVLQDAIICFSLLKIGGIMALDDYMIGYKYPDSPGSLALEEKPKTTIDFFVQLFKDRLEVIYKDYQIWLTKTGEGVCR